MTEKKKNTKSNLVEKIQKNPWKLSTFLFAILSIALMSSLIINDFSPSKKVGEDFVDFINSKGGTQIKYIDSKDFSPTLYEVTVLADGNEVPAHVTKDGLYFVQVISPLVEEEIQVKEEPKAQNIPKSDKPLAQLFVMTHCPYGTQAEKGFLPIMKLLNSIADLEVRFVHYYMHTNNQEEVETPRQVCIREEQPDLFIPYLECFLGGTSGSVKEAAACEIQVGIDSNALADCIDSGRGEEYYNKDAALSEAAGVRGSPSLVLNGQMISSGRSESAFLETICSAFNNVPELCNKEVSKENPSPGFGYGTSGSPSTAQC